MNTFVTPTDDMLVMVRLALEFVPLINFLAVTFLCYRVGKLDGLMKDIGTIIEHRTAVVVPPPTPALDRANRPMPEAGQR